jgi:NAD(P)-dependent dehydrogenase (short-subunit alcohol dehydrogenase family)
VAARGIGRAIALALASDGRQVAIGDLLEADARATVDEIERAGGRAAATSLDVTDSGSVAATVQSVAYLESDEAQEGVRAFSEKREPDFAPFPARASV